jgi:hypothetical protein
MTPRIGPDFHSLKSELDKILYMKGMPIELIKEKKLTFDFRNEQINTKLLSAQIQRKAYEQFLSAELGNPGLTMFCSNPTDYESLAAASQIIRTQIHDKAKEFKSFQFVSPWENPPFTEDETRIRAVYVLMGAHQKDEATTHQIRRWVRAGLGSSVWVCMAGDKPYDWSINQLGIKPQFLFSLKSAGVSVG